MTFNALSHFTPELFLSFAIRFLPMFHISHFFLVVW